MSQSPPIVLELTSIPDFLKGVPLAGLGFSSRLKDVLAQWVQFTGTLWTWKNAATFAIRYVADSGRIRVWILAAPDDSCQTETLLDDLRALCRAHDLPIERVDDDSILSTPGGAVCPWENSAILEVRQFETDRLWKIPQELLTNPEYSELERYHEDDQRSRVPFPWQAPGGAFLLPMEKLVSLAVPASLSVYLRPTELTDEEYRYISTIAKAAESTSNQSRQSYGQATGTRYSDPMAGLVGRIFSYNARRLADKPFLVSVCCAAADARIDAAQSLAGMLESILYEPPFDMERSAQDDLKLPSAAETIRPSSGDRLGEELRRQYSSLQFRAFDGDPRSRIPYLVDARGAATFFRLPINVSGGVPGAPVKQRPPDFHPGPRSDTVDPETEIALGDLHQEGKAKIERDDLCKHALVTGFTGSGKTETVLGLVDQLQKAGIPTLTLESAKREYRGLLGVHAFKDCPEPIWVFTVGNETCAPFRLNPFELLPGVRVEQHINRLQTCVEAALPQIGPLASMIGEALVDVYEERGWRLTDVAPEIGEPMFLTFPEMSDFARRMSEIPGERNYQGEVLSNVTAAVTGRIKPLTVGSKGLIFRPERRYKPGEIRRESAITRIFSRATILELEELSLEDKAFFVMVVLTFLREHRSRRPATDGKLKHVTIVEEAHNVLENVESTGQNEDGSGDSRYKAVQAFSLMLSEIRALGEGLIIVDQSPEKLAPDAMRNTNLHIAHQLRDSVDRDAIARAMIMDEEQRDYLGKLEPGRAALFYTGLQKATFVTIPKYRPSADVKDQSAYPGSGFRVAEDVEIRGHMNAVTREYRVGPFDEACVSCSRRADCNGRNPILRANVDASFGEAYSETRNANIRDETTLRRYAEIAGDLARSAFGVPDRDQIWCAFVHLWHGANKNRKRSFPQSLRTTLAPYIDELAERAKEGDADEPT